VTLYDCAATDCVEAAALANQERYLALLALSPDWVWETDEQGDYRYASPAVKALLGVEPGQLLGRSWLDLRPAVEREGLEPVLRHHLQSGAPIERLENIRLHQDGRLVYVESSALPLYAPGGQLVGFRGVDRDVTAHRELEARLRDSQQKSKDLLESISAAYLEIDPDGRIVAVSQQAGELLGQDPHRLLGQAVGEALPALVGSAGELVGIAQATQRELYWAPTQRWYEVRLYPSRAGLTIYWVDITPRKQAEAELHEREARYRLGMEEQQRQGATQRELLHRLIDQREDERRLIARELHDGPVQELYAANLALQAILMDVSHPGLRQQLQGVADMLQTQIRELRGYAGELRPPTLSKFGVGTAIQAHLETFQEKNPETRVHFSETGRDRPQGEEVMLALFRIYQEAMSNIAKHAQASEVRVRLKKGAERVVLEIRDNGVGFEPPRDWLEMARQGHLGLVGLQERAAAVGGQVQIRSQKQRGTWVRVVVPTQPPPNR